MLSAENRFQPLTLRRSFLNRPFLRSEHIVFVEGNVIHHIYLIACLLSVCVSYVHVKIPLCVCVFRKALLMTAWLNSISQSTNGCSSMYWKYVYFRCPFHGYCGFLLHGWLRIFNRVYLKGYFYVVLAFGLAHPTIWQLSCISEQRQYVLSDSWL